MFTESLPSNEYTRQINIIIIIIINIIIIITTLQPLVGPLLFSSFLILYTVGGTPWTGDQPVARPLCTHRINTHNRDNNALNGIRTHDSSVRASKTVRALDPSATVIGLYVI
jgi:hypothetical protein